MTPSPLLVLGGTFDPPHLGHLQLLQALDRLWPDDKELVLMPTFQPVHKSQATATADQRLAMLQRFVAGGPVRIDSREMDAGKPCYTVDSLAKIRAEQGSERAVVFVMGGDSFAQLHHWHGFEQLLCHSHLLWFDRNPQPAIIGPQSQWPVASLLAGRRQPAGLVLHLPFSPVAISSSAIRQTPALGLQMVPKAVYDYYSLHRIYA